MLERFIGDEGRGRLLEVVSRQMVAGGDQTIALALIEAAELLHVESGQVLIAQDAADDDIYLLLAGQAAVRVNERVIATRTAGTHVGEMALIDPASPRSATVLAGNEGLVVARIPSSSFTTIADRFPTVWRRLGLELVRRLQERGRFHAPPNALPEVFIGSSKEHIAIAKALADRVSNSTRTVRVWTDGVFAAGETAIESLLGEVQLADFAVLVLGDDDVITTRDTEVSAPRDNVIFELGLFMSALGRERALILRPRGVDLHIPSDLLGITPFSYDAGLDANAAVEQAAVELDARIKRLGAR